MSTWRIRKTLWHTGGSSFRSNFAYTSTRHNGRCRSIQQADTGYIPEHIGVEELSYALNNFFRTRNINADWLRDRKDRREHGTMVTSYGNE